MTQRHKETHTHTRAHAQTHAHTHTRTHTHTHIDTDTDTDTDKDTDTNKDTDSPTPTPAAATSRTQAPLTSNDRNRRHSHNHSHGNHDLQRIRHSAPFQRLVRAPHRGRLSVSEARRPVTCAAMSHAHAHDGGECGHAHDSHDHDERSVIESDAGVYRERVHSGSGCCRGGRRVP